MANIPNLNINAIGDGLQDRKNYEAILDILQRYRKELNFYLMNLDLDNMPAVAEGIDWIRQDIDGVKITVGNNAGDIAALVVETDQISATVANNIGNISTLTQTASSIQTLVSNNAGDISSLVQTAQGIQTQVTNNTGNISTVAQTANSLTSTVSSLNGRVGSAESSITQLADEITAKVTIGEVTSYLSINRSGVQINANNIDLTGITTMYGPSTGDYFGFYGNGVSLYESNIRRLRIYHSDVITIFDVGAMRYYGYYDFSQASVDGLELRFA